VEKVVWDVKNGLVSIEGAKADYGVVIADPETLEVDAAQTARLRKAA
jgi:N-methylhydantoinase B